jgi:dihydrodipicolinate synthase/N-acetylneuraminate lyase
MGKSRDPVLASGVYAAILTSRQVDSSEVNVAGFFEYIDRVCRAGPDGIVLFGSTGEFVHYDIGERMRVLALAVRRSRVPVLVNVSHSALQGAVDLAEQAEDAGAAGILLMPPYFYRYLDGEVEQFYFDFLKKRNGDLPIYLYNLPVYTNALSNGLVTRLLSSGKFAGIKDSSGSKDLLQLLKGLRQQHPFQFLIGNDALYVEGLNAGADGVVSGIAAALPELIVAIRKAFLARDNERLESLSVRLRDFCQWTDSLPACVAIKCATEARQWLPAQLAVPLGPDACQKLNDFRGWFAEWLPATLQLSSEPLSVRS